MSDVKPKLKIMKVTPANVLGIMDWFASFYLRAFELLDEPLAVAPRWGNHIITDSYENQIAYLDLALHSSGEWYFGLVPGEPCVWQIIDGSNFDFVEFGRVSGREYEIVDDVFA